jgi:hypothetical protein
MTMPLRTFNARLRSNPRMPGIPGLIADLVSGNRACLLQSGARLAW